MSGADMKQTLIPYTLRRIGRININHSQIASLNLAWRLVMERSRLWRRYLVEDLRFFGLVARDVVRRWR